MSPYDTARVKFLREYLYRMEEDYLSYTYLWTRLLFALAKACNPFHWHWGKVSKEAWQHLREGAVGIFMFLVLAVAMILALPISWVLTLIFPLSVSVMALVALIRNRIKYKAILKELEELEASARSGN